MNLEELLEMVSLLESNRASVYHATGLSAAIKILRNNKIEARTGHYRFLKTNKNNINGVSTTRDLNFAKFWLGGHSTSPHKKGIIFELDTNKIKTNNKVLPVDYYYDAETHDTNPDRRQGENAEAEEFVVGDINNIDNKLIAIHISDKLYQHIVKRKDQEAEDKLSQTPWTNLYNLLNQHQDKIKLY